MNDGAVVAFAVLMTVIALAGLGALAFITMTALEQAWISRLADEESDHYESTACFHGHHDLCRLECKHCGSPCRCECHEESA